MFVLTNPEIFTDPRRLTVIVKLVDLITQGPHHWILDLEGLGAAQKYFATNTPHSADYGNLIDKSFVDSAYIHPSDRSPVSVGNENLDELVHDLGQSAAVVVEDSETDGIFLHAIFRAFGKRDLIKALENHWLIIRHSGGSGRMARVAIEEFRMFRVLPRVCVLLDSDRLFPGHVTSAHKKAAHLLENGISVHVLERREAENYIPNRAVARHGNRSQVSRKLTALKTLTAQQRAHFDMKRGFRQKEGAAYESPQNELFKDLLPAVARALGDGFGNAIIGCLKCENGELSPSDFASLGDGVEEELERLLTMISRVV